MMLLGNQKMWFFGSGVYEKYYANGQLEEKEDENHIWKSYNEEGRLLEECDTTKRYSMPCTVYNEDGTKSWSKRSLIE